MRKLFSALLVVVATQAHAVTGNALLNDLNRTDATERLVGVFYVMGYLQAGVDLVALYKKADVASLVPYCAPQGVTGSQAADVAKKYLTDHPATRQQEAGMLVLAAFMEAWPCPSKPSL